MVEDLIKVRKVSGSDNPMGENRSVFCWINSEGMQPTSKSGFVKNGVDLVVVPEKFDFFDSAH